VRLSELAKHLGLDFEGDGDAVITGCAPITEALPGDLTFVAHPRYVREIARCKAGAVILSPGVASAGKNVLRAVEPQTAFANALAIFDRRPRPHVGVHPTAVIAEDASLGVDCHVGAYAVIGAGAVVGEACVVHPHVTVYPGARIGPRCTLHAGVVIREDVVLGEDVTVQPGAVVGADGFGFLPRPGSLPVAVSQIGTVEVGDHVDIGANTTIDRAAVGRTRVGRGAKIDNLVQLAHGCQVGDGSLLAAQVGIAGSSRIGRDAMLGGQVGITGHVEIGDRVRIAAQSGVVGDIPADAVVGGMPAFHLPSWRRCIVALRRLPELLSRVRALEEREERRDRDSG
jgi:UDP-3-O-[3-hydroxymyristoyl] glucosamine N-acyltransferase